MCATHNNRIGVRIVALLVVEAIATQNTDESATTSGRSPRSYIHSFQIIRTVSCMGGTGSVLQHEERKTYGRTEETRLLKLYNRQNREDKLSGKLRAVGIENFEVRSREPNPKISKFRRRKVAESAHHPFKFRRPRLPRREVRPLAARILIIYVYHSYIIYVRSRKYRNIVPVWIMIV